MKLSGRRYDTGQPVCLEIEGAAIARVTYPSVVPSSLDDWPWIAPGLLDIQVNGRGGQEFSSPKLSPEKVAAIVQSFYAAGVTRLCPTMTTASFDVLRHAMRTVAATCEMSPAMARRIAGIHLEGPYISAEDGPRGAHPAQHCRRPDWDEFQRLQEASGGRIRILTMGAEFEEGPAFVERVVRSGVVAAIGHTGADGAQIRRLVDAGARLSTHLGNGSHSVLPRLRNYIWAQLAEDRLMASIIADGYHLPPEVVQTIVRAKSPQQCILVSDISGLAGLPPGRCPSEMGDIEILADGRLVVAGQREFLAGASAPLCDAVANVMRFAGLDLATAVHMATEHPARLLGLGVGRIEPGQPADLLQFDIDGERKHLSVRACVADGELLWGSTT